MNHWNGTGRLTRDPDIRVTQGQDQTTIARFTVACDRRFKKDGQDSADFISCVAFGKLAEWFEKYIHKGMKVEIDGRIQTGSYEKDGVKHYTTDIIVESAGFGESKKAQGETTETANTAEPEVDEDGFINVPEGIDSELPFA